MCFFGLLFVYVVRVNFSVAIICMVRVPTRNVTSGSLVSQSYSNVSHHRMSLPVARNTYPGNETTHGYIHQLSETSDTGEAEISDESSCSTESEDPSVNSNVRFLFIPFVSQSIPPSVKSQLKSSLAH